MSPRAYIVVRVTRKGRVWHVRFKRPGGSTPVHWGAYPSRKLAERARDFVNGEFAVGRYPDARLLVEPPPPRSLLQAFDEWVASFPERGKSMEKLHRQSRRALVRFGSLGRLQVDRVTHADVQAWVNLLDAEYAPATVRKYLEPVRGAFVYAGVEPNPARDTRVRLPAQVEQDAEPPSWDAFQAIGEAITPAHLPALFFLERHGLRIQEFAQLQWGDIDLPGRRIRIAAARSKSRTGGRRFVPLLAAWAEYLDGLVGQEDRLHDRLVFPRFNENTFRGALSRACKVAKVGHYSPHDLRHRYISLLLLSGVDVVLAAKIAGHKRSAITMNTYGHVLLDEPQWRLDELRLGVSWVSGLTTPSPLGSETLSVWGFPIRVEDTGI